MAFLEQRQYKNNSIQLYGEGISASISQLDFFGLNGVVPILLKLECLHEIARKVSRYFASFLAARFVYTVMILF